MKGLSNCSIATFLFFVFHERKMKPCCMESAWKQSVVHLCEVVVAQVSKKVSTSSHPAFCFFKLTSNKVLCVSHRVSQQVMCHIECHSKCHRKQRHESCKVSSFLRTHLRLQICNAVSDQSRSSVFLSHLFCKLFGDDRQTSCSNMCCALNDMTDLKVSHSRLVHSCAFTLFHSVSLADAHRATALWLIHLLHAQFPT